MSLLKVRQHDLFKLCSRLDAGRQGCAHDYGINLLYDLFFWIQLYFTTDRADAFCSFT